MDGTIPPLEMTRLWWLVGISRLETRWTMDRRSPGVDGPDVIWVKLTCHPIYQCLQRAEFYVPDFALLSVQGQPPPDLTG